MSITLEWQLHLGRNEKGNAPQIYNPDKCGKYKKGVEKTLVDVKRDANNGYKGGLQKRRFFWNHILTVKGSF